MKQTGKEETKMDTNEKVRIWLFTRKSGWKVQSNSALRTPRAVFFVPGERKPLHFLFRDGPLEKFFWGKGNFRAAGTFFRYHIPCMNFF